MQFASRLETMAASNTVQQNILTDGQFTVTYATLPTLLTAFADDWGKHQLGPEQCLAVECPNTIPGALTLLYLLQQGISFVLLPPSEQAEQVSEWKPIPQFCQARLVVKRAPAQADADWVLRPENFLLIEPNLAYQPCAAPELQAPNYLFLRTSGSMGASKLVVHTHATLLDNAQRCVEQYQYTSDDRVTLPVPIAHMYGLGVGFLPAILAGANIDLQDQSNLLRYLAHEKRFQPTVTCVTPTLAAILLKGFKSARHYRLAITATQRIGEATFHAFDAAMGGCFVNQLGSSEMGAIAVCSPDDTSEDRATTIGKPFPGVELRIDESLFQHDDSTTDGSGELYCRHPAGFLGYVDERGAWLQRYAPTDWYRTGDLARQVPNGYFQITGRAGNSVNRRGYLVHFAELERQMEQIMGLEHVVVVSQATADTGATDKDNGSRLTAFCTLAQEAHLTDVQIRKHCFDALPHYAIPDEVHVLDALPLLASGKVDRQRLRSMASSATVDS
ncbi:MAG: acyl--CoA ligase [Caldilineaceae bacterium]|nr:acyl--CoA ligase [Caldilineaceae bacterium]